MRPVSLKWRREFSSGARALGAALLIAAVAFPLAARPPAPANAPEALKFATPDAIAQYLRDRFNIPSATKLIVSPLHVTPYAPFYESTVVADDGREKHPGPVYISADARCFVLGDVFALGGLSRAHAAALVRKFGNIPAKTEVSVGAFGASPYPGLLKATVTAIDGKEKRSQPFFATRDGRTGALGLLLPFRRDFVEELISTRNQPTVGPANAPVTIVEFADLECPSCAALQKVLDNQILSAYRNRVRVIFKEYPLPMHPWARTAALANECARRIDPPAFLKYRDLIFTHQADIKKATARSQLLGFGAQAGVDRRKLAACLDSGASEPSLAAARREAEALGVSVTPTLFVNGRPVVGAPPAPKLVKIIDQALAGQAPK